MQGQGNNIKRQTQESTFQRIERMHPHKMLLYLTMIGSSLIFLFMVIAYTISKPQTAFLENFSMPKAFVSSTVLLLLSGFCSSKLVRAFKDDQIKQLRDTLGLTLLLGIAFAVSQYIGWTPTPCLGYLFCREGFRIFFVRIDGLTCRSFTSWPWIFNLFIFLHLLGFQRSRQKSHYGYQSLSKDQTSDFCDLLAISRHHLVGPVLLLSFCILMLFPVQETS